MSKTTAAYDDGDAAASVLAYTDTDGAKAPAGVCAFLSGTTAIPVTSTDRLPVSVTAADPLAAVLTDAEGNPVTIATATPSASDRAIVVRNIPSGTQAVSGTVAVTQSGSWAVALGAGTAAVGTVTAVGAAAHDSPVSGNPVLVGGVASSIQPVEVADGDAVRVWCDPSGALKITPKGLTLPVELSSSVTADIRGFDANTENSLLVRGVTVNVNGYDLAQLGCTLFDSSGTEIDLAGFVAAFLDCYDSVNHAIRTTPA